jgi:large subunit ribosomal protein L28
MQFSALALGWAGEPRGVHTSQALAPVIAFQNVTHHGSIAGVWLGGGSGVHWRLAKRSWWVRLCALGDSRRAVPAMMHPPRTGFQSSFWSLVMAQICNVCGKGPQFGNNISHAHNISRRRWNVNLRPVKAKVGGGNKRIRVCTSCIKAGKVTKA